MELAIFEMIHQERTKHGLNNLAWSDVIAKVARKHSEYQLTTGKMGHEGPRGDQVNQRLNNAGVAWLGCGENVACAEGYDEPLRIMGTGG